MLSGHHDVYFSRSFEKASCWLVAFVLNATNTEERHQQQLQTMEATVVTPKGIISPNGLFFLTFEFCGWSKSNFYVTCIWKLYNTICGIAPQIEKMPEIVAEEIAWNIFRLDFTISVFFCELRKNDIQNENQTAYFTHMGYVLNSRLHTFGGGHYRDKLDSISKFLYGNFRQFKYGRCFRFHW